MTFTDALIAVLDGYDVRRIRANGTPGMIMRLYKGELRNVHLGLNHPFRPDAIHIEEMKISDWEILK